MNLPTIETRILDGRNPSWEEKLDVGLVKVKAATFVSALVSRAAIESCGLPNRRFFIWGDDLEYTERITSAGYRGFLAGKSKVLHKRAQIGALSIVKENNPARIKMMTNLYRNMLWTQRQSRNRKGLVQMHLSIIFALLEIVVKSPDRRLLRIQSLLRGAWQAYTQDLTNRDDWEIAQAAEIVRPLPNIVR